ncbi:MAG: hypothetical protein ACT4OK_19005 [Gemmobacter sp.]
MFRRIYRQRRRLLLAAFFIVLATYTTLSRHSDDLLGGMHDAWWVAPLVLGLTSLILGAIFAAIGILVIILIPDWRGLIEIVALTFFADSILAHVLPDYFGVDSTNPYAALSMFALYYLTFNLIYGSWLDRFRFWLGFKAGRSYVTPLSPDVLWRRMVLGAAPLAEFYDPLVATVEPHPDGPDSFIVAYRRGQSVFEHQTITYVERQAGKGFRYRFHGEGDAANRSLTEGSFSAAFSPTDMGETRVTLTEHRPAMLPRDAIQMWLDDRLGDTCDGLRAQQRQQRDWSLTGRYRRAVTKLA